MLRQLWDKISTRIRPDRASLDPFVDFDPESGSLSLHLEAEVRGQKITIDRLQLRDGFGFVGNRKFRLHPSQITDFQKIFVNSNWRDESTAIFDEQSVPDSLSVMRSMACRESPGAKKVTTKDRPAKLRVKTADEFGLRFEALLETDDGNSLRLELAKLSSNTLTREGSTFYRVSSLPLTLVRSISTEGWLEHAGDIDRVRELGSVIREVRNVGPVEISADVELLMHSAESPVPVDIRARMDFEGDRGTVRAAFDEVLPGGTMKPAVITNLTRPHLANGVFCEFTPKARELLDQVSKLGSMESDNEVKIVGKEVPEAVSILRGYPFTEETATAKRILLHDKPLESRTFLELDDPETLIVRQNLQASDGREIKLPEYAAELPDWIRVKSEYFRPPDQKTKPPSRGQKIQPGEHRLTGDEVPEFIDNDLQGIRQTSRVFADPNFSSVKVVTANPELQTEINLDENTSRIKVRPRYRSGTTVLEHSEISSADRKRRYYRRGSTYHRLDWELYEKVCEAVAAAGLEEEPDGSFTAPSLHYDEIIKP